MKIVIDINEHIYEQIMADSKVYVLDNEIDRILIENAIYNGTQLPEHHGDLVDRDAIEVLRIGNIKREYDKGFDAGVTCMVNRILDAPTIIEADKGE